MNKIALIWKTKDLRMKILIVLGLLLVTRVLAHIPIPGIDASQLQALFAQSQFLNLLDLFSGGGLTNFSIAMLGVGPYITASIIMQLMTIIMPSLAEMSKEGGEAGRAKINQITRYLTIPLAFLQGFGTIRLLQSQGAGNLLSAFSPFQWFLVLLAVTSGTMLIMWLGEIMSEFDIGNGISLIIFAGIVARLPASLSFLKQWYDPTKLPTVLGFLAVILIVIAAVVLVTEAQRNIPIAYAKRVRGNKLFGGINTHLPLRLNQSGVIPIIFALSLLLIPQMAATFFSTSSNAILASSAQAVLGFMQNLTFYGIAYFILVFFFTYFYTAVTFDPHKISENLQKNGAFIPGVRPGNSTTEYLSKVITRITFVGALFLGVIAVLPIVVQSLTGIQSLALGGTALLIVVSVILDLTRRIDAQLSIREY